MSLGLGGPVIVSASGDPSWSGSTQSCSSSRGEVHPIPHSFLHLRLVLTIAGQRLLLSFYQSEAFLSQGRWRRKIFVSFPCLCCCPAQAFTMTGTFSGLLSMPEWWARAPGEVHGEKLVSGLEFPCVCGSWVFCTLLPPQTWLLAVYKIFTELFSLFGWHPVSGLFLRLSKGLCLFSSWKCLSFNCRWIVSSATFVIWCVQEKWICGLSAEFLLWQWEQSALQLSTTSKAEARDFLCATL